MSKTYAAVVRRSSDTELQHGFKYIKREKINGRWRYYYDDSELRKYEKRATETTDTSDADTRSTTKTIYKRSNKLFDEGGKITTYGGNLSNPEWEHVTITKTQGLLSRAAAKGEKKIYDLFLNERTNAKRSKDIKQSAEKAKKWISNLFDKAAQKKQAENMREAELARGQTRDQKEKAKNMYDAELARGKARDEQDNATKAYNTELNRGKTRDAREKANKAYDTELARGQARDQRERANNMRDAELARGQARDREKLYDTELVKGQSRDQKEKASKAYDTELARGQRRDADNRKQVIVKRNRQRDNRRYAK